MVERERLEWVIDQHYKTIDRHYNQRIKTKNWCLTMWLILITLIASGKLLAFNAQGMILSLLPILMFWIIEAMQASHMKIMEMRVAELEKLWTGNSSKIKSPNDLLFYGSHQYQSSKVKFDVFIFALFRMETVFAFYLLLALINFSVGIIFMVTQPV
ncbi:MAG TPA: hypothetical protein VGA99_07975 [bacterium]